MKKTVILLLVIALLLPFSLTAAAKQKDYWNIHAGTSLFLSQLGVSRDVGLWEFGVNASTGLTFLTYYELKGEQGEGQTEADLFWETVKKCLSSFYGVDIYAKYDMLSSGMFDFDVSLGLAGLYIDNQSSPVLAGFAMVGSRITLNLNEKNGIYLETNVPFYAIGRGKNSETGEMETVKIRLLDKNSSSDEDTKAQASALLGLYFYSRIGYRISF